MQIGIRAQSAMEYLMTYGWAILIIAVVLGALFELGVFSGTFFMPHVPPGACHVFRPYGPRTVGSINLEGECQGALPQYVAEFNGAVYITIRNSIGGTSGSTTNTITYAAWVKTTNPSAQAIFESGVHSGFMIDRSGQVFLHECSPGDTGITVNNSMQLYSGTWNFVAIVYSDGSLTGYVDGSHAQTNTSLYGLSPIPPPVIGNLATIGYDQCDGAEYLNGFISNVQVYNASLSANDIQALYQEGIGGAPQNLQNLVGWWPLNGNANDYSGNNNYGTATNVVYTTNWESGYTQP